MAARVREPQFPGEGGLQVEDQPILAPAGEEMQPHAQPADEALGGGHGERLALREESVRRELLPRAAETGRAGDPYHRVQIAQPAGAFLDVGLEVVRGIVVLEVPLLLLERLRLVERPRVERCGEAFEECRVELPAAGEQAVLEKARAHRHVAGHLAFTVVDGADRVTDLEPGVPQRGEKALDLRGRRRVRPGRKQDQDVDVGVREELAPPVTADGNQRDAARHRALHPETPEHAIDEAGMLAQQPRRVRLREECLAQRIATGPDLPAPARDRRGRRDRRGVDALRPRRHGNRIRRAAAACPPTRSAPRSRRR